MRRSVQPNCPRAMTCCFFVSLKMLAMPAEGPRSLPPRQRLERLLPMAVFQVSMYGRFWVSTEVYTYDQYKRDVEEALVNYFGRSAVVGRNKAFDVHENTYRVDADVV